MTTLPVSPGDLTARTRIRDAAVALFGADGFDGTSIRAIAKAAGVSPALVIHHFGTKEELRAEVEHFLFELFEVRMAAIADDLPADELSLAWGEVFGSIIGPSPELRAYVRRALLEGSEASGELLDRLLALCDDGLRTLDQAGALRAQTDTEWRPFQILFVILGPLLFEPLLARHYDEPFDPELVRRRSAATHELLTRGLLES